MQTKLFTTCVVGFSGTRNGMTPEQKKAFKAVIWKLRLSEFHHGDCIGADADAHDLVREVFPREPGRVQARITIHPPTDTKLAAFKTGDFAREPLSHLKRNNEIVKASTTLIACPWNEDGELDRGGTWYTIRKARQKLAKAVVPTYRLYIIRPSGRIEFEKSGTDPMTDGGT